MSDVNIAVIKLGGSLLDMPDLISRLQDYLLHCGAKFKAMVVGGGAVADWVREFDRLHHLGDDIGHWEAVRAMNLNAHLIAHKLNIGALVKTPSDCRRVWQRGELALLDPQAWLRHDEADEAGVPHRWTFTSDSIAAHVAERLSADRLTLLKSTLPQPESDIAAAVQQGVVDADFVRASANVPRVEIVNFRSGPESRCVLR